MKRSIGKPRTQTIIPPEGGWKRRSWYLVEASFNSGNPIHRRLFYTGFLNGEDSGPGGYNYLPDQEDHLEISDVYYMKAVRLIVDEAELEITPDRCMPPSPDGKPNPYEEGE